MNSFKCQKSTLRLFWEVIRPFVLALALFAVFALLICLSGCGVRPVAGDAQVESVPPDFLKWSMALVVIALGMAAAWKFVFAKGEPTKINDNPPPEFRKAPKRYNHELDEARHREIDRRLDGHDAEIEQLWTTMRKEDTAIRNENGAKFDAILEKLGEIRGELKGRAR